MLEKVFHVFILCKQDSVSQTTFQENKITNKPTKETKHACKRIILLYTVHTLHHCQSPYL